MCFNINDQFAQVEFSVYDTLFIIDTISKMGSVLKAS